MFDSLDCGAAAPTRPPDLNWDEPDESADEYEDEYQEEEEEEEEVRLMRDFMEIHRAHDILQEVISRRVPCPIEDDTPLRYACDVLCWVLQHDHNPHFASNLKGIEEWLEEQGFELKVKVN